MEAEHDLECQMIERLLESGHPQAFAKGLMMADSALQGGDGKLAQSLLELLGAHPTPGDMALAMAQLASDTGAWLMTSGDAAAALDWFGRSCHLAPKLSVPWANRGAALIRLGRMAEARTALERALELDGNNPSAWLALGNLAHAEGRHDDAIEALQKALALDASSDAARTDLAEVLKDKGLFDQALDVLSSGQESPGSLTAQGNILKSMGDSEAAAQAYLAAYLQGGDPATRAKSVLLTPVIPDDLEQIASCRRKLEEGLQEMIADRIRIDDPERAVGTTLFHLAYHGLSDRPLMELAARFWREACSSLTFEAPHIKAWAPGRRLKIGFVSRHLHAHTMAKLNRGIIADLDRERFEVFIFQIGKQDETALEIAATADHACSLAGPLDSIRATIAGAKLDILYYPDIGMEPTTYFLAHARLAPVQVVACGHPDTTGLDSLDAFLSGDPLDQPNAQAHYTEPLIRLSGFPFYLRKPATGSLMPDRESLGLPENKRLYVCPQSLFKFHPEFDAMLGDILKRDPKGQLVLIEQLHPLITARLKARMTKTIPDLNERLIVLGRLSPTDFMTLLVSADAVLDPWRFGGGSSSLEAFAQGVPVVTRPGDYLRERVTMAAYAKMGLTEMVADSAQSYADIAVRLAQDYSWSAKLADQLRQEAPALFLDRAELKRMEDSLIGLVEAKR
ncbi:MAG: tetratricopeptide repeat protein [Alphaproteobacteria bacterium]|nr:tetratricopeptide repeat protein [Alphaproteobacteria bacterium]